jgi:cold shock CspA family protein
MQKPLEIVFRGLTRVEEVEDLISEKVAKLEHICNYIVSCSVAIEKPQHYQKVGNPFRVRLDIRVPHNHEIVVKRECTEGDMHDSLQKVLRNAFDAAGLALQELVQKQRHDVKSHPAGQATAIVHRIFPDDGYGFLLTTDGREVYFHRNSLVNQDFSRVRLGLGVRFTEELGEEGPQASTMEIMEAPGAPFESSLPRTAAQ